MMFPTLNPALPATVVYLSQMLDQEKLFSTIRKVKSAKSANSAKLYHTLSPTLQLEKLTTSNTPDAVILTTLNMLGATYSLLYLNQWMKHEDNVSATNTDATKAYLECAYANVTSRSVITSLFPTTTRAVVWMTCATLEALMPLQLYNRSHPNLKS